MAKPEPTQQEQMTIDLTLFFEDKKAPKSSTKQGMFTFAYGFAIGRGVSISDASRFASNYMTNFADELI